MRIVHLVSRGEDVASVCLVEGLRAIGLECVLAAPADSPAAAAALERQLPTVACRADGAVADLIDAMTLLAPDVVHVHGAIGHGALPLRVVPPLWPSLMTLTPDDLDADGVPAASIGVGGAGHHGLILPRDAARDLDVIWRTLPKSVRLVAWQARLVMAQCADLYTTLLHIRAPVRRRALPAAA